MGSTYRYRCGQCGYTALVGGGPDGGFVVMTQTGFCEVCSELVDFATDVAPGASDDDVAIGACFRCGSQVERVWNDGEPCPRCGGEFDEREFVEQWI